MNATELKSEVERYRIKLKERVPKLVAYSPSGPIGMELIDLLVQTIVSLQERVSALEKSGLVG